MVSEDAKLSAEAQSWQAQLEAARSAWNQKDFQTAQDHFLNLMSQSEAWLLYLARQQVPRHLVSEVELAVAQTYVNLWRMIERGDPIIHTKGLLRQILKRRLIDLMRSMSFQQKQQPVDDTFWEGYDEVTIDSPEQDIEAQESEQLVNDLLARLPPVERDVFIARHLDQQSVIETAEQLKLTEDQVKKRCRAAIQQLRQYLNQQDTHHER